MSGYAFFHLSVSQKVPLESVLFVGNMQWTNRCGFCTPEHDTVNNICINASKLASMQGAH